MGKLGKFLTKALPLLDRLDPLLPPALSPIDWNTTHAFRWQKRHGQGNLMAVHHPHQTGLDHVLCRDRQKSEIDLNTRQFLRKLPANNVLLWGARGTGKSSLVKAVFNEYREQGLRLIEIDKHDLTDLPDIVELIYHRPERFILFCDDLSFSEEDASYKALKALLDGSIASHADNLLVYATSNRRHLLPEYMEDNERARNVGTEIHQAEVVEEKISLSERFGIWVSFHPFDQDEYLSIVKHWLNAFGFNAFNQDVREEALRFALTRGSRSGRVAWQFAKHWAGSKSLE